MQKGPEKDGMKGLDTATVTFKDVRVPSMNVLGESVGKGSAMLAECSLRQVFWWYKEQKFRSYFPRLRLNKQSFEP